MLLTQFKEVSKIDTRIQKIHQELAELYERRNVLTKAGELHFALAGYPVSQSTSIEKQYDHLVAVWSRYGLKPPTLKYLKQSLNRAMGIMDDMIAAKPELHGRLGLVLVPPTKDLQQAAANRTSTQKFVYATDSIDSELPQANTSLKWRLFVMYTGQEGLVWASARTLLADELYRIGGHDASALGQQEYTALTLQATDAIDQESWSMLLGDANEDAEVLPCGSFENGRYRFDRDDLDNIFGDNRFRPAVEV
jgi:hypothetical protein